jgi:cytochrome c biogenesis protein CcmG/thiol:disulfide interchange protein DsbE
MPALEAEALAPNFALRTTDGQEFSLDGSRKKTPVILAFFKVGCPTCQYAFPYLERLHKAYPKDKLKVVGVSQDTKENTLEFMQDFGVTFPVVLDDTKKYPASNAYGLTNVPSIFLVSTDGRVEVSSVGWSKPEIEDLNRKVAKMAGVPVAEIFKKGEQVADFKAG